MTDDTNSGSDDSQAELGPQGASQDTGPVAPISSGAGAFWSTQTLRERINSESINDNKIIRPFLPKNLQHSAYELTLGAEAYVTNSRSKTKEQLQEGDALHIPSGQFALLLTEEVVNVPRNAIAFISVKYTLKSSGLVNVSGFHVDPDYKGRLKFAVYNAGPQGLHLQRGQPYFLIWFADLDHPAEEPYPNSNRQTMSLSDDDIKRLYGNVMTPQALATQVASIKESLEERIAALEKARWKVIAIALFILATIATVLITLAVSLPWDSDSGKNGSTNMTTQSTAQQGGGAAKQPAGAKQGTGKASPGNPAKGTGKP